MSSFKTSQDIKVGVIGYGGAFNMGRQHLTFMKKAGMTPVAVAELDETRLKVAQEEFPVLRLIPLCLQCWTNPMSISS